jgi:hypothetical protein
MVQNESTQPPKKAQEMKPQGPSPLSFFALILSGLWLLSAPATFAFESNALVWSDFICGALLIALSLWTYRSPRASILWAIAGIGVWLQCAPLLFWAPTAGAYVNNILIGTLVITLAVLVFPMPNQVPDEEPSIPPGWTYNPSSWPQRLPIAFFAFICWMISKYLAADQLGYVDTVWDPFFTPGTEAGLGALAYSLEFIATCQGGKSRWRTSPWGVFLFGVLSIPLSIVSTILVILQPLVVGTWCTLCLITAVCMLIPIPLALDEVIASWQYLQKANKDRLRLFFKGGLSPQAKTDTRTPPLNAPLKKLLRASLWGVTFPWTLSVSILCSIILMSLPTILSIQGALFDADPIIGAVTIIISVLAYCEWARSCRYCNLIPALILCVVAVLAREYVILHLSLAIAIGLLCIPQGTLKERKEV